MRHRSRKVLHGAAPDEVKKEQDKCFMLLQDTARKLQHNEALAAKRRRALARALNHFLAALVGGLHPKFRMGFRAHYSPIRKAWHLSGSMVTDEAGEVHDLKRWQPAPGEGREPREAFKRLKHVA